MRQKMRKDRLLESRSWWSMHKSEEAQVCPLENVEPLKNFEATERPLEKLDRIH